MRRRWIPISIMLVIGGAILASIVSISIGEKGPAPPVEGSAAAQRLYGGIEQSGNELGDPGAPVTISIFNDVQCPECGEYQLEIVPPLIERYVRTGDAVLELRHFSIGSRQTTAAAIAATAAGEQGQQWQYAQIASGNIETVRTTGVTPRFLRRVAESIPSPEFDVEAWKRDLDSAQVSAQVQSDAEVAAELRLPAEPAVVVEGPKGERELDDSPSLATIEGAVQAVNE